MGPKTFLWIGDATGHGVPAALVTSAARSAARILEELPDLPLNQAMSLLNKAINGTSRGKVNMTFFLGVFNEETQILQYCNASHDPPFLIPHIDRPLKKNDILPLMKASGARLGESPDSEYNIAEIQLKEGDKIVLYTDGVTELRNSEGELWGERRLIRSVLKSTNDHAGLKESLAQLDQSIADFRQEAALEDDLTYFMFQYLVNSQI
ncbi:MAG: serine/threonine-protein phosphatase [Bdellovibrionales bacterium]|nr:serine/threonine-protein phosphatase [Bdellovibrionales bacterium]